MTAPRKPTETDPRTRHQQRRRVKRGIVASYIHEISGRHSASASRDEKRPPERVEQGREA
jgi:hypothetical protein